MKKIKWTLFIGLFCVVTFAQANTVFAPISEVKELTIQERITNTFKDPRMVAILTCESGLQQYRSNGIPKISNTNDVGIAQINQIWWEDALNRGFDIFFSEDDNLKMAKIIYDKQGIGGWTCSHLVDSS